MEVSNAKVGRDRWARRESVTTSEPRTARPAVASYLIALLFAFTALRAFALAPWVHETPSQPADFPLVQERQAAVVLVSAEDHAVARVAATDFAADVERVTGLHPIVSAEPLPAGGPVVLIGTLGRNPIIDNLAARGRLDVSALRGAWESFIITTIDAPVPGVPSALVIVGSDRRGTAFGVYELSQAIGVSPWYWWADVTPEKKSALHIAAGTRRFGPPSVQYRGIFLNDEDWGLQPWAAKTFEPEVGDIGPKTYAKICELLLRLKANTLWPAMHACTKAFNHYPENKLVADRYAIVMGSSHAEPMLRNNVTEWTAPKEAYDYVNNRDGVHAYWEQRVRENGKFENIYTLGMRGIHDSHMVGPKTDAERIATLEKIFADQRAMIAQHVNPAVEQVPQMFCAYKEVLDLYRQGLKVPDDVTIVWPDDNFGYIRNFATPEEQKRSGGFGVYYHLSYLGRPLSYLWLSTTPPALIWSEMHKAYEHGARKIWIVNVGDLKPAEIGTEFFLQMAWDINRWNADNLDRFLPEWAEREFGAPLAEKISNDLEFYYRLNFDRRPEHLQWWLSNQKPQPSPLAKKEAEGRLKQFNVLTEICAFSRDWIQPEKKAAFEQLVGYPIQASGLANARYFYGELGEREKAEAANRDLIELTRHFNEDLSSGKWRGFLSLEPANDEWKSMRIAPWKLPDFTDEPRSESEASSRVRLWTSKATPGRSSNWKSLYPLGEALLPTTAPAVPLEQAKASAATLSFDAEVTAPGDYRIDIQLLPTHPIVAGRGLRVVIGLGDEQPRLVTYSAKDGSAEWAQGVLNNYVTVTTTLTLPSAGKYVIRLYGIDPGVVVRTLILQPAETSAATKQ